MNHLQLILPTLAIVALGARAQSPTVVEPPARAADSILTAAAARGFNGVALAEKNGQPILRKAYGLAQRENRVPFATNTVVQIGSNTKDFTSVAIMQLVARGKLQLSDSLARLFPDVPADKRGITVRQLMNHRSGLPHAIAPDSVRLTRAEFLDRVMRTTLSFTPGTKELYSNPGFSVLAAIIEKISGASYDEYLRDNILAPLGLRETGSLLSGFSARRVAHGYASGRDKGSVLDLPHLPDGPSWTLRGNGGMVSTVDDMAAFYRALFESEKLLPAAVRNQVFEPGGAMVLAGSDLTSFFMYQREPQLGVEVFLASTSTEVQAPALLRPIMATLGLRAPVQAEAEINAPAISLPATPVANTVREYLEIFHKADSAAAVAFFNERFVPSPNAPPPPQRFARLSAMRAELQQLSPIRYTVQGNEVELVARAAPGEVVVLTFDIEPTAPYRIRSLRIRVGD